MDQNPNPFPANPAPSSGNIGPLAAAVVIVLLLAVGGFYFFYTQQTKRAAADAAAQAQSDAQNNQATVQSDSIGSMEAELNATETSGSDADLQGLNESL